MDPEGTPLTAIPPSGAARRRDPWLVATVLAGIAGFALLLYLDHTLTFWLDEWAFIGIGGFGTFGDWLRPHNEHWSTLPFLLYEATFSVVQLHSYLPYIAELLVIHVIAAAGLVALVRRDLGPAAGFVAALPILLIGSGYQNIEWAFQTGFVGSVATGAWAVYALASPGRRAVVVGSVLLVASLMCSSVGLFWFGGAAVELALDASRRRRLLALVPPAVLYAAWYLAYGMAGAAADRPRLTIDGLRDIALFIGIGVGHATGAFTGLGNVLGAVAFAGLALVTLVAFVARKAPPRAVGALAAMLVMFSIIALARTRLGLDFATRSRYVYVAAFFLVLAVSSWLRMLDRSGRLPLTARLAVLGFAGLCLASNVLSLPAAHHEFRTDADLTRAFVTAARQNESASWFDPTASILGAVPASKIVDLTSRYGDPNIDVLWPGDAPPPSAEARERALILVMGRSFRAVPGQVPSQPVVPTITDLHDARIALAGGCLMASATAPGGFVSVLVTPGGSVTVTPTRADDVGAWIGRDFAPAPRTRIPVPLTVGSTTAIEVPDTGGAAWQVHLELPQSEAQVCVAAPGA